jgi:aryl-alcohol dehydrogenase-like predicted oxidoreductase
VNRIGLGTAQLAFQDITAEQAVATVHAALDSGVRLIDTALAYTRKGVESFAEEIVARALAQWPAREEVLVATKGGHRRAGDEFPIDARPSALRADCETSLRNLGVERISLYQLHWVDPLVPLAESVGALRDLQRAGKIAEIGLSNVTVAQIEQARAEAHIATVQNRLSLADRDDLPTVAYCASIGLRYLAYLPLGGRDRQRDDRAVREVSAELGITVPQVWVAWTLAQGEHVTPLVGSSRPATIRESAGAGNLSPSDLTLIRQSIPGIGA